MMDNPAMILIIVRLKKYSIVYLAAALFICRHDPRSRQKFTQILDQIFIAYITLMRVMQKTLKTIQSDMKTRTMSRGNAGPQMMQQGLNLPPMYIATHRVMENRTQQTIMLVTHDSSPLTIRDKANITPCRKQVK